VSILGSLRLDRFTKALALEDPGAVAQALGGGADPVEHGQPEVIQ
jgi:hypothetical protein